jgi:two-component system sensor histidine kinase DesK
MFFRVAPDSVIGRSGTADAYPRSRWIPLVMLVWTIWIFINPIMSNQAHWLWPTLASFPIFLVLYFRAYYGPRRQVLWCSLGMAVLAFALTPINVGAMGYLIYSGAFLAFTGASLRVALQRILFLNAIYALECLLLHWPTVYILSAVMMGIAISCLNLLFRRNQKRDAELSLSHDEVRRLAASAERERIGRDLHDLLGHTLSMVALKSELAGRLIERDPASAGREMAEVARVAREALSQVRSAVRGIRAAVLVSELASARLLLETAGVQMEYWSDGNELPPEVETCLALVLREAVTNIQRHARANRVEVTVIAGAEKVVMRVRDDGRGGVNAYGNGLSGLRVRIVAQGGELWIESPRGRGTIVEARLPLPPAHDEQRAPRNVGGNVVQVPQHAAGGRA